MTFGGGRQIPGAEECGQPGLRGHLQHLPALLQGVVAANLLKPPVLRVRPVSKVEYSAITKELLTKTRPAKPPAVLVYVPKGRNFAETIAFIKSAVKFPALGGKVQKIRKTRGHRLVIRK